VLLATGRAGEAEPLLRESVRAFQAINQRHWRVGDARARLGQALIAEGRGREGIAELETGWTIYTETTAPTAPRSREIAGAIAAYYESAGDPASAKHWNEKATSAPN
jgi:hypothetical protein